MKLPRPYEQFRDEIRDGDLLLWRPTSLLGRAICLATWADYSHASMAAWNDNGRLYNLEMVQWQGGRHVLLSHQLAKWPGSCEVWRPRSDFFDGHGAVKQMMWLLGQHYGWSDFARITTRLFFPRIVLPKAVDSDDPDVPRVCSAAYCFAARTGGGFAPCPGKPDLEVSPADLAKSQFASYIGTPTL